MRQRKEKHVVAQRLVVTLVDDLDGSEAHETVHFGLDGVDYEIELSKENATELRDALGQYIQCGRWPKGAQRTRVQTETPGPRPVADRVQAQAIREWARKNGHAVSNRGRIPSEVVQAYHERKHAS